MAKARREKQQRNRRTLEKVVQNRNRERPQNRKEQRLIMPFSDRQMTPDELIEGLLDAGFSFDLDDRSGRSPIRFTPANPKPLVDPQPSTNGSDVQDEPLTRRIPPPHIHQARKRSVNINQMRICLLYTSDAADE